MKEPDDILRSDGGYQSVVAFIILCSKKDFHSGIFKLFEGSFLQSIKLHVVYFSLTDINIMTVVILFSIHSLSIHTPTMGFFQVLN